MDMMELRRRLMIHMAQGAEVVKGAFTVSTTGTYTLNFGKTFTKYIYLIEMTDSSKTALMSSGQTSAKMYSCIGEYPSPKINNDSLANTYLSFRIIPTTGVISASSSTTGTADESSVALNSNSIGSGANSIYNGYSYNYTIVSLE